MLRGEKEDDFNIHKYYIYFLNIYRISKKDNYN